MLDINRFFKRWDNPKADTFGDTALTFLEKADAPTHIFIQGKSSAKCRVVVTLLHGNEPSGLQAILQYIREQHQPAVDMHFFIPNVAAAKAPPGFYYRMLPGERDLNRCFHPPFLDHSGAIAKTLLENIRALEPECVIDIHNTSGEGPSFGVVTFDDIKHDQITLLFTEKLIVTDLKLGAIMEISETIAPTVTIECGGAGNTDSQKIAFNGLLKFCNQPNVFDRSVDTAAIDLYHNPIRLEFKDKQTATLNYAPARDPNVKLTLLPGVEKFNFGEVPENTLLGFCDNLDILCAVDSQGQDRLKDHFHIQDGTLRTNTPLKLFMVTGRSDIAVNDCLFYFVSP